MYPRVDQVVGNMSRNKSKEQSTTEELISKICSEFSDKIEKSLSNKLEEIRGELKTLNTSISHLSSGVAEHEKMIKCIDVKVDDVVRCSKQNSLRIHGFEEVKNESLLEVFVKFAVNILGIPCNKEDIDFILRVPRHNDSSNEKPRTILVNFVNNWKKLEVFNAKKRLKGKQISIFEDLPKNRFELLQMAKKKVGNKNAWSLNGKLYMWNEEEKKKSVINCANDI